MTALLLAALLLSAPQDVYRDAEAAEEAGDLVRARDLYVHFVEAYPKSPLLPGALLALAWVEIDLGRPDSALARLVRLDQVAPPGTVDDALLYTRAAAFRAKGNLGAAEADLRALLADHPGSNLTADAEYLLGLVLSARGRPDEADALLTPHAEAEGPDAADARAARAHARTRAGRMEEALEDWREVSGETAAFQRALLLDRLGRGVEARAAYEAYLDSWPWGPWALRARAASAGAAAAAGDTAAAVARYEEILSHPAGRRSAWTAEALRYLAVEGPAPDSYGRWLDLARAHASTAEGVEALTILAGWSLDARRLREATDHLAALQAASPDAFRAGGWGRRMAEAYFALGDARAGLSALRAHLAEDLPPGERLIGAFLLSALGRADEAEPHLLRVAGGADADAAARALAVLARNRFAAGDVEGARAARDRLRADFPALAAALPLPAIPDRPAEAPLSAETAPPLPAAAPLDRRLRLHVEAATYGGEAFDVIRGRLFARAVPTLLRLAVPAARDVVVVAPAEVERLDEVYLRGRTDLPPDAVGAEVVARPRLEAIAGGYVLTVDLLWIGRPAPARRVPLRVEIPRAADPEAWAEAGRALLDAVRIEARL